MLKYNYVIFSWLFLKSNVKEDYYAICLRDLEGKDNIIINHMALQEKPKWLRYLYMLHHCSFLNKYFSLPFKKIWYPYIFENSFTDEKPICFVCVRYPSAGYLKYLRKVYPNCKIVVLCRDLLKTHKAKYDEYTKANAIDVWMSYDEYESRQYGFPHFEEFESKIDIPLLENYPIADVFFAGAAKDRLPKLLKIYDQLNAKGIKCLFYITGTSKNDEVKRDGIRYLRKPITYVEMLTCSVNSKCILEINQGNAIGYSSRFLEAVIFNKKLITDNMYIKKSQFYDPIYIQFIEEGREIDTDFIMSDEDVDYHYQNEFSPMHIIELIDNEVLK